MDRGEEKKNSEKKDRAPPPARPHYPASPLSRVGAPPEKTPVRDARPPSSRPEATASQRAAADARPPAPAQQAQPTSSAPVAKRPTGSPKSVLEADYIIVHRLLKSNLISGDLARAIAMSLNDRQQLLDDANEPTPDDDEMTAARNFAALTPIPQAAPSALKRQRTDTELRPPTATKQQRVTTLLDEPLPQRDPRLRTRTTATPAETRMDTREDGAAQPAAPATQASRAQPASDGQRPSTSFADAARAPRRPADADPPSAPSQGPTPPPAGPAPSAGPAKKPRYPPLIVETLPTWAFHLRQLKAKLGRAPNARPFGKGIKFTPTEDQEYRLIQRYLTDLEKSERISWFSYSLPQDRSLKVAIRGIPVETDPEEIAEDLRTQGFEPEIVRPIKARKGRPGCIFFAILRRTPDLIPAIYGVNEILCMPGVHIEAWRGKKGPAQCHRCQKFRHSSHGCHRAQACVRCGEEHRAFECPRPREEPATCANCGGPHPANNLSCPVFRREARNKRAGTVAATTSTGREGGRAPRSIRPQTQPTEGHPAQPASSNLRTEANDPTPRGAKLKKGKKKGKKKPSEPTKPTSAAEPPSGKGRSTDRQAVAIEAAIQTLSDVLLALRAGEDPIDVVLRGMSALLKLNG